MTKIKLIEHLNRKLEQARQAMAMGTNGYNAALTLYNQAFGAVEFAGLITYQDSPETEAEIIKMWNDEYRPQFEKEIWG